MNKLILMTRRILGAALLGGAIATQAFGADPAPNDVQARFEVDFLTDMIAHHQGAIAMANLVAERTERAELEEMAGLVATAQETEIETMQEWLEEWYGETADEATEPELDRKIQRQIDALAELTGAEFEEAFLKAMSLHHAEGIDLAKDALLGAYHTEIIDLSREMMAAQADEIALMRGWLMDWHEVTEVTPRDRPDNRRWSVPGPRVPVPGGN